MALVKHSDITSSSDFPHKEYIATMESFHLSVQIFAPNREILYSNKYAFDLYGYTPLECIGQNGTKLLMEEKYYSIGDEATAQTANNQYCNGMFPVINKRGEAFKVVASNTPFFSKDHPKVFRGVISVSIHARDYQGPLLRNPREYHSREDPLSLLVSFQKLYKEASNEEDKSCLKMLPITNFVEFEETQVGECSRMASNDSVFGKVSYIPRKKLTIYREIGQGQFGKVFHGKWKGMDVAIKAFSLLEPFLGRHRSFKNEVSIMKELKHVNVLKLFGVVLSPDDLCLVTEFLPRGSLFQLLHKDKASLDWRQRIQMALDTARGMDYLHSFQPPIIHRDLKSPNLLVTKNWMVKVGDLGLACPKAEKHIKGSPKGTLPWMAPETSRDERNDEKSDVYGYGVVLWELVTGKKPPQERIDEDQMIKYGEMNQCFEFPKDLYAHWLSVIERCWHSDPDCRPTFGELINIFKSLRSGASHTLHYSGVADKKGKRKSED